MHVLVMGAGVVGVTTAYYLLKAGHQVTILDRQPKAGQETSFANGGQISVSHVGPWAGPQVPWQLLKSIGRSDAPLLLHPRFDPALIKWGIKFLANCQEDRAAESMQKNLALATLSRDLLTDLRSNTGIEFEHQSKGILQIFRNPDELASASAAARSMTDLGCQMQTLDVEACLSVEPALESHQAEIVGGIYSPDDESGDANLFAQHLAAHCSQLGAAFHYGVNIEQLSVELGKVEGVVTDQGLFNADSYVLSMGSYSNKLVRPFGLHLPIYPTKGYSITVPTAGHNGAPTVSITDDDNKLVFSRLGDRLRVAGTAEFAGFDTRINPKRAKSLVEKTRHLFPSAGDFDKAEPWTGLRPLTPDGRPIISKSLLSNLFLNTGHGTLGWTLCCGSGLAAADLISGFESEVNLDDFNLTRFQ